MKNTDFKNFLFKSAVMAMACDGHIAEEEINAIKKIAANEISFMEYDIEEPLKSNIDYIKANGKNAINQYLQEISGYDFNEHQELLLMEIVLNIIQADQKVETNELNLATCKIKIENRRTNIDCEISASS